MRPSMTVCLQRLKDMQADPFFAGQPSGQAAGQGCACTVM